MALTTRCPECGAQTKVEPERAERVWVLSDGSGMECAGTATCAECGDDFYWSAAARITEDDLHVE